MSKDAMSLHIRECQEGAIQYNTGFFYHMDKMLEYAWKCGYSVGKTVKETVSRLMLC